MNMLRKNQGHIIGSGEPQPPFIMHFNGKDETRLGTLKEEDGKLVFEGNAKESAKKFFDWVSSHIIEYGD